MKAFDVLKERGYVYQITNEEKVKDLLNNQKITFYFGIDPTADSLHIGHFFALTIVRRLQKMGHKAIIVIGGATAMVGDPSGKAKMRDMLSEKEIDHNKKEVRGLIERFVDVEGSNRAIILDNADWINGESYIGFLRKIGVHFNVNKMLAADCYKKRLKEGGLTFLEMGYMLMQAYDFVYLNREHNCVLQVGGSDQWGNIVAGVDLGRKLDNLEGKDVEKIFGLTCPLLVKADGEKMGKTESGTLWVSREKTTVYDFYQMFINSYDEDVERLMAFFGDYEMDWIKKICDDDIVEAKKIMAFEVTKLVHGEAEALKVRETCEKLFAKGETCSNMPTFKLKVSCLKMNVLDFLVLTEIVSSKSEAKRLIEQKGIKINKEVVLSVDDEIELCNDVIVQRGKKIFLKVVVC